MVQEKSAVAQDENARRDESSQQQGGDQQVLFNEEMVRTALRAVMDPEVGMNIVDLGLVYRIALEDKVVAVDMTMTSPACPMGDMLLEDVDAALRRCLPAGFASNLQLVWEPPWSDERMSEAARTHFGWDK
jgi:metal-sulfur cluster biosynthetic enzyme